MNKNTKLKIFKLVIFIMVVLIMILATFYLFPVMKNLSTKEGQVAFKQKISNSGIYGVILLFLIQLAQIFLFILPGEPIEIISGMCYGGFFGTIFIMASSAIISILIFSLVKKYGKQFIYDFCDEKKVKSFENKKIFQNPKKIELIFFLLFLIPGTPKDFLTYVAGLCPIKMNRFVVISTIARIPSIVTSTLAGAHIANGNWKNAFCIYIVIVAIVLLILFIYNLFDKDKTTKTILDSIKKQKKL